MESSVMTNFVVIESNKTLRVTIPRNRPFPKEHQRFHWVDNIRVVCSKPFVNGQWDRSVSCGLCDLYDGLWREIEIKGQRGSDTRDLMAHARELKPIERIVITVIDHSDGQERLLSVGKSLYKKIVEAILDSMEPAPERSWFGRFLEWVGILKPLPPIEMPVHLEIWKEMRHVSFGDRAFPQYHLRRIPDEEMC